MMNLEIPMIAKIKAHVEASFEVDSFVDGSIKIWTSDKDSDGDPEINCKIDLPGESFDKEFAVEIPIMTVLSQGPAALATLVLDLGPDFPFKATLLKSMQGLVAFALKD